MTKSKIADEIEIEVEDDQDLVEHEFYGVAVVAEKYAEMAVKFSSIAQVVEIIKSSE